MRTLLTIAGMIEMYFEVISIVAGIALILAVVRLTARLSLSSHRLVLLTVLGAAVLSVASEVFGIVASVSHTSTFSDAAEELAQLIVVFSLGVALYLISRAEREEISPLLRWANTDELTGLASRSFFRRAADRRITLSENYGTPLTCVVLDVDDFKPYNDRYGHESGDRALQSVARVLNEEVRADDLVARYGGEEFIVLANSEIGFARELAERIRRRVEHECVPQLDSSLNRRITVSLGVACLTASRNSLELLVQTADAAMYRAKRTGKNRVSVVEARMPARVAAMANRRDCRVHTDET